ncbi:hypothetical protein [Tomitella cavernea]|uniref:hypothetical protein n=1 Tax=Tomitella cavernea TaxID=1387982 RepID=UPI001906F87F|nr:hypothetical protein [Tomitella cavernea]
MAGLSTTIGASGCSSPADTHALFATSPSASSHLATGARQDSGASTREEELIRSAEDLDHLAADGEAEAAWAYYSQRCKDLIGGLSSYRALLNHIFKDRTPEYGGVTVRIDGSSAQVVTVDNSPTAPAGSMDPRTWTYIDGRWQFDNC